MFTQTTTLTRTTSAFEVGQQINAQLIERIYRDMLYKAARGEKFPVDTGTAFGVWIGKTSDLRLNKSRIEAFNGYTWMKISSATMRVWLKRARRERSARHIAIGA